MNWNQPMCRVCYAVENPGRVPSTLLLTPAELFEICSTCGMPTTSGIYVRKHPKECNYPASDSA